MTSVRALTSLCAGLDQQLPVATQSWTGLARRPLHSIIIAFNTFFILTRASGAAYRVAVLRHRPTLPHDSAREKGALDPGYNISTGYLIRWESAGLRPPSWLKTGASWLKNGSELKGSLAPSSDSAMVPAGLG